MNQQNWLDISSKTNPLIHLKLSSTIRACEEHLTGVSKILSRLSGTCRSREVDIVLGNAVDTAVYALNTVSEQISLAEEKESSEEEEVEKQAEIALADE